MKKFVTMFRDLHEDKSGAAFIEYTVLLGVILAVIDRHDCRSRNLGRGPVDGA